MARTKRNKDFSVKGGANKLHIMGPGVEHMTYKDIKRRAVALGMPFQQVVESDWGRLASFITKSTNEPDLSLIDKFDDWMDQQLAEAGYPEGDPLRNYQLRLGFIGEKDPETGETKTKRVKGLKKPKEKKKPREVDANGLWKGTKKSYTYELALKGHSLDRVIRRVTKKFPDAQEKTIKQWFKRAIKSNKDSQTK